MPQEILIIDDDVAMCDEIAEMLRCEGFNVEVAHNGTEGSTLIGCRRYDLLILDLRIPGLSGFDILRELKDKKDALYVIVLTGQAIAEQFLRGEPSCDEEEEQQYNDLQLADGILSKPFDVPSLLYMVRSMVDA